MSPSSRPDALTVPDKALRFGHPEVFALIAAASFVAARFLPVLQIPFPCPFRVLTGIPCASCGMTHAFVHLAHGAVGAAWSASPLGALLAVGAWGYAVLDILRVLLGIPLPRLDVRTVRLLAIACVVAVLVNWGWLIYSAGARG